MGADLSKEYPSTWEEPAVQKWKKKALEILRTYYLGYSGTQWHEFNRSTDIELLRAKICYALFGPPTENADDIESAYSTDQKTKANEIRGVILKVNIIGTCG